jgi:hypothetical protein
VLSGPGERAFDLSPLDVSCPARVGLQLEKFLAVFLATLDIATAVAARSVDPLSSGVQRAE